jgi:hypothetical protein
MLSLVILTIEQTLTVIRAAVGNHNTMILQKSKNHVWYVTMVLKNLKIYQRWAHHTLGFFYQFFHENHQFFKGFEIIGTSGSLTLICSKQPKTSSSLLWDTSKTRTSRALYIFK